jgi:hypothetical protein
VLVLALGVIATIVLLRAIPDSIPRVTNIQAQRTADSIEFYWEDPGLLPGDAFQVSTNHGTSRSIQQSTTFSVDAKSGDRVCLTVTVRRDGKPGDPSAEKCVEVNG